jgi:tetratricopeptide (TPR) repeat protein
MRRNLAISLGLVLITLAAYSQVGWLDFVNLDDPLYASNNPHVRQGLTQDGAAWAFTTRLGDNWHPLTWLSLMLDSTCFGVRPAGYHLMNLAGHAASAVTLFLVLCRMTGAAWRSSLVAALFAVHPLHVESVAWVAERKDVLSTLLGLLALAAYVGYARRPGLLRYALVFVLLALGLLAKPMLVTLPLVLLLLDYWPLGRWPAEKAGQGYLSRKQRFQPSAAPPAPGRSGLWLLLEKIPLLVLSAASSIVTYHVQQTGGAVKPLESIPLGPRLANALVSYVTYIGQMFWPADLAVFYPFGEPPAAAWVWAAAALLLACSAGAVWGAWRGRRWLAVGWAWYLGMLAPVIGVVQVGEQAHADRYAYLPLVGLFLAAVWAAADRAARWRLGPSLTAPAAAALLLACMLRTAGQVQYWANTETLFKHALAVTPDNPTSCDNLAAYLWEHGRPREARRYWEGTLMVRPTDQYALQGIVLLSIQDGRYDEAARQAEKALQLHPDADALHYALAEIRMHQGRREEALRHLQTAHGLQPENTNVLHNLARLYLSQEKLDAAAECCVEVLRLKPDDLGACNDLAGVRMRQRRFAEAEDLLRRLAKLQPGNPVIGNNLATVEAAQGKHQEAMADWAAVLDRNPQNPAALNGLAWALSTSPDASVRDGKRATALAEQAVKLSGHREPNALDTLAAACAEAGRFRDAIRAAEEGIALAQRQGDKTKAAELRGRLELYRRGTPFREIAPQAGIGSAKP